MARFGAVAKRILEPESCASRKLSSARHVKAQPCIFCSCLVPAITDPYGRVNCNMGVIIKNNSEGSMKKNNIIIVFLIINALILFFALNPWITNWSDHGILVLIFEVVLIIIIGIPVLLYQMIRNRKTLRQSFSDSLNAVLDFLSSFG